MIQKQIFWRKSNAIEDNINIFLLNVLPKIVDPQNVFSLNKSSKKKEK